MADPVGIYASHQDVIDEMGEKNLVKLSDLDSTRDPVKMAAVEQKAISLADDLINSTFQLAGYQLPLAALPGFDLPMTLLKICAAKIAHWQLYNLKGKRDNDQEGDHLTEKMEWAVAQIQRLIDGGLPAVLIPSDGQGGNEAQRGVIKTIKINQARYNQPAVDEFSYP